MFEKTLEKIKGAGVWLKEQWKGIVSLIVIGVALAFGGQMLPNGGPEQILEHLLLKAPPAQIQGFNDLDATTTHYKYITDIEVKRTKYSRDLDRELTEDISKRTKNAQVFLIKKDKKEETWGAKFYLDKAFYKDEIQNKWFETDWGTTTKKAFKRQMKEEVSWLDLLLPEVYAVTATTAVGTGDGWIGLLGDTWDNCHDGGVGTNLSFIENRDYTYTGFDGADYDIYKAFYPIPTGAVIPDNATVTGGKLYLNFSVKSDTTADGWIVILESSQAYTGDLILADYDQCGAIDNPDELSNRLDIADINLNVYNFLTLNTTGTVAVSKTATTTFCTRERYDVTDVDYPVEGSNRTRARNANNEGTTEDPYLWATWTVPTEEVPQEEVDIIGG